MVERPRSASSSQPCSTVSSRPVYPLSPFQLEYFLGSPGALLAKATAPLIRKRLLAYPPQAHSEQAM